MIGLMNVPADSPTEFYTSPETPRKEDPKHETIDLSTSLMPLEKKLKHRPTRIQSIFGGHRKQQSADKNSVVYLQDGRRKLSLDQTEDSSSKMWEQLIVRSFVHKMGDEIERSPDWQEKTTTDPLDIFTVNGKRARSNSTFSLVSDNIVIGGCKKCSCEHRPKISRQNSAESAPVEFEVDFPTKKKASRSVKYLKD